MQRDFDMTAVATSKEIDTAALALLQAVFGSLDSLKLPVDLNQVAEYCGVAVRQGEFEDKTLEGALDRRAKTVFLSEAHAYERKTFALAHELGHFKLHDEVRTDVFTRRGIDTLLTRNTTDPREYEADLFAASLLMPEMLLRSLWTATGRDLDNLAKIFGVPTEVCHFRLTSLQLI